MSSRHKPKSSSSTGSKIASSAAGDTGGDDDKPPKKPVIPTSGSSRGYSGPSKESSKNKDDKKDKRIPKAASSGGKDDGPKSNGSGSGLIPPSKKGKEAAKGSELSRQDTSTSKSKTTHGSGSRPKTNDPSKPVSSSSRDKPGKDGRKPPTKIEVRNEKPAKDHDDNDKDNDPGDDDDPGNDPPGGGASTEPPVDWRLEPIMAQFLPAEMRFRVYSYMLDGREVRYYPQKSEDWDSDDPPRNLYQMAFGQAHAYAFDFTLFKPTNKATRDEATKYFYLENKLILLELNGRPFERSLHCFDLPFVDNERWLIHHNMQDVTLSLEFQILPGQDPDEDNDTWWQWPTPHQELILHRDFGILCDWLKFYCQYLLPPAVYITSGRDEALRTYVRTRNQSPKLSVKINEPDELTDKQTLTIFNCLKQIIGGGHGLTITSKSQTDPNATPEFVADCQKIMAPRLIFTTAMVLDQVQTARALRDKFIKYPLDQEMRVAQFRLCPVSEQFVKTRQKQLNTLVGGKRYGHELFDLVGKRAIYLEFLLILERLAIFLVPEHLIEDLEHAPNEIRRYYALQRQLQAFDARNDLPRSMKLKSQHMLMLSRFWDAGDTRLSEHIQEIRLFVSVMHSIANHYPQVQQDLAALKPYLDDTNEV